MTKVLALVVEQLWHVYWISLKFLVSKDDIFTPFCYKFIHVTAGETIDVLDLSLIKL